MTRNFGVLAAALLTLSFVAYACTSGEVVDGPATGSGNTTGQGTAGAGNVVGTAGTTGGGNNAGVGNNQGQGNGPGRGGTTGSGNTIGSAGSTGNTGGVGNTVGTGGVGNTTGRGGTTGTGNTVGTGGVGNTTGTGGSGSTTCPPSFQVTTGGLVQMPAIGGGCWQGYAFTFTETPTCGSTITPKDFAACGTACMLSSSGMISTATATNNYCAVVGMGFSINQAAGASTPSTLAPMGQGIKVTFSESAGTLPFRVQLRDDSTSTGYCYSVTGASPVMIPYASFNTKCYDTPADGTAYSKTPFTSVQILIAGGAAASTFSMALMKVEEY